MTAPPPRHFLAQNRLLRALSPATVQQMVLSLQPLALRLKETLITRDEPITSVYFPLDAVVSVVSTLADGTTLEVGTIGNEGMVGLAWFLQAERMPFTAVVQVPGAALKLEVAVLAQAVDAAGSEFRSVLAGIVNLLTILSKPCHNLPGDTPSMIHCIQE